MRKMSFLWKTWRTEDSRTGCPGCPNSCRTSRCGTWPSPVKSRRRSLLLGEERPPSGDVRVMDAWVNVRVLLPAGSHDSMSFCLDMSSPVLGSEPRLLRAADRLAPCWTRPCVSRWATTQVRSDPETRTPQDPEPRKITFSSYLLTWFKPELELILFPLLNFYYICNYIL